MEKAHLLITGSNGLVASQFMAQYGDQYVFDTIDLSNQEHPVDITKLDQVQRAVTSSSATAIIHCAAYTNVTEAWKQQDDRSGAAYQVNVIGTAHAAQAAAESGKHIVHISTPYIFDGTLDGLYAEDEPASPIEWYGYTKAEAERVLGESAASWTILRIDQPFRSLPFPRPDTVQRIISGLESGSLPPQFTDHTFGPTFLDDFAHVLHWAVEQKSQGIFHATSGEKWTDYDFAVAVKKAFGLEGEVQKGSLSEYLAKSNRPYQKNTALSTKKLQSQFGVVSPILDAIATLVVKHTNE